MSSPNSTNAPASARKVKGKTNSMSAALLRDIRGTAAFYAWNQVNRMDSMPVKEQEDEMARQFWGNNESDIASTLNKLLNGDEAFCNMYEELFTTEDENHRILKKQCHGGEDLYRAGYHSEGRWR